MPVDATSQKARIPVATYRLQFNREFTFMQATELVQYLSALGISDCYSSPLQMARPGSMHGYDVIDHSKLNPELGSQEQFTAFARLLRQTGMGLILDLVPNHMCVAGSGNKWWNDVLESGQASVYANYFDINWDPPKNLLHNRVLLPILGERFGTVLENQQILIHYEQGAFFAMYYETRLPLDPRTYRALLELAAANLKRAPSSNYRPLVELETALSLINRLPERTQSELAGVEERQQETEAIKARLAALVQSDEKVRTAIGQAITEINGLGGQPHSFDRLESLLAQQAYRLCYWRVAPYEINYRRFFDVSELAAIRMENPAVFSAVHEIPFRLIAEGWVTGLRIDHIDGLYDSDRYLRDLQRGCLVAQPGNEAEDSPSIDNAGVASKLGGLVNDEGTRRPLYVLVEKILCGDEQLPPAWPIHGTTGYDFMNQLNGVFVDTGNQSLFVQLYRQFTGCDQEFKDIVYESKKLILLEMMFAELHSLSLRLERVAEQSRHSQDFTMEELQSALAEVIACFPVYRTYTKPGQTKPGNEDLRRITDAIAEARGRNAAASAPIFDFIGSLLQLVSPDDPDVDANAERSEFVLRFQQLTGPVMAKGVEDTAFYRYYPLASLNEVGGEPDRFGISLDSFHSANQRRLADWPHSLLATSTHDTKRSEDVRARINVLSEMPDEWFRAVSRWRDANSRNRIRIGGAEVPDANEEYLLYQTLIGAWPFEPLRAEQHSEFVLRIENYIMKALREAKVHISWARPNQEYERAIRSFAQAILKPAPGNGFLADFRDFHSAIARAGVYNSLSQTLLKITSPGVPDFYQGTEIWDFSLVDPDNRRQVDYATRRALLDSLFKESSDDSGELLDRLVASPEDGRIKLYVTQRALEFRRNHAHLFSDGDYMPLFATGQKENHVVAFRRRLGDQSAVVAAGRFFTKLGGGVPTGEAAWGDTQIPLGSSSQVRSYLDVLTGCVIDTVEGPGGPALPVARAFARLPQALLTPARK